MDISAGLIISTASTATTAVCTALFAAIRVAAKDADDGGIARALLRFVAGLLRRPSRSARNEQQKVTSGSGPRSVGPALRLMARLMPAKTGRRWLAEADSFLFETAPHQRAAATRNYLLTAPCVIATAWTTHLSRRALAAVGRIPLRQDDANH
jgi:hypothetical protein